MSETATSELQPDGVTQVSTMVSQKGTIIKTKKTDFKKRPRSDINGNFIITGKYCAERQHKINTGRKNYH